jgi:hypothetical protein
MTASTNSKESLAQKKDELQAMHPTRARAPTKKIVKRIH